PRLRDVLLGEPERLHRDLPEGPGGRPRDHLRSEERPHDPGADQARDREPDVLEPLDQALQTPAEALHGPWEALGGPNGFVVGLIIKNDARASTRARGDENCEGPAACSSPAAGVEGTLAPSRWAGNPLSPTEG